MPVSAAPVNWQCSSGAEKNLFVSLDPQKEQVVWQIKTEAKTFEFTETARYRVDWVEWSFLLPATMVRMHHRMDRRSGELSVTQGDSGAVTQWLCTVVPYAVQRVGVPLANRTQRVLREAQLLGHLS